LKISQAMHPESTSPPRAKAKSFLYFSDRLGDRTPMNQFVYNILYMEPYNSFYLCPVKGFAIYDTKKVHGKPFGS